MDDPTKEELLAIPEEIIDAIAGGSMSEDEAKWLLDYAAGLKQHGYSRD